LTFDQLAFAYDSRTPVLSDVSLEVCPGEIVALAGPSGSGKTTILGLLLRFFDPTQGDIRFGGTPIREFDLAAWRSMLSVALQENPLFTASVRDNVRYGHMDASEEQILNAVESAALGDFVQSLPAGLETMLGEKGSKLSTGQAQRIGIARAMLRDSPILLLDEPTSALDGATEQQVMLGIRAWVAAQPHRRMAIVATHRRTTAAYASRTYRIDAGRVVLEESAAADRAAVSEGFNG